MSGAVAPARRRWALAAVVLAGAALSFAIPGLGLVNQYVQFILITIGINILLSLSLNLAAWRWARR